MGKSKVDSKARANETPAERKARKAAKKAKKAKIAAAAEALVTGARPQKRKASPDAEEKVSKKDRKDKKDKKKKKKKERKSKPLEIVPESKPATLIPGALASKSVSDSSDSDSDDNTGMGAPAAKTESRPRSNSLTRMRTRSMDKADKIAANSGMSADEFRKKHQMEVEGLDEEGKLPYSTPDPIALFSQAPFSCVLKRVFDTAGFATPTPIQAQAWPICVQGRDMISVARTGSGKTLGFLLPTFLQIQRLAKLSSGQPALTEREKVWGRRPAGRVTSPLAIVLAPTRELAMQINVEAVSFCRASVHCA